jgi:hypothetical protein
MYTEGNHLHLTMAPYSGALPRQAKLAIDFALPPESSPHEESARAAKN